MDIKLKQYLEESEKRMKTNLDMPSGDAEIRAAMDELFGDDQQNELPLENQLYQVNILDQTTISDDVKNDLVNIDNLDLILNDNKTEKLPKIKANKKSAKATKKSKPIKLRVQLDELLKNHKEKLKEENSKVKKIFKQKRKKKLMMLTQPDQCSVCGKIFHYKGYLEIHMKSHQNLRPYECQYCHKKFTQSNNLTIHLRSHTGKKPFQCEKCSKFFSTSSNLNAHLKIHIGIKNFHCTLCPRAFKSQAELQSHQGTHSGIKNRVCKMCGKSFYKTSYLNVHIRNIHQNIKKYKCPDCDKSFSSSSNLICHKRIHSGEKPYGKFFIYQ
jgi:KRAB domain-containing zinc finger protein